MPVTDVTNGIIVTFSCCHSSLTSMTSGVYFSLFSSSFSTIFLSFSISMLMRYVCFSFLSMTVMSGRLQDIFCQYELFCRNIFYDLHFPRLFWVSMYNMV